MVLVFTALRAHAGFSTVVLDAGHGGHDRGGIPGQRYCEKEMALDLTRRVGALLRDAGLQVVLTRKDDTFIPLPGRVAIANSQKQAVFVSVHFNSAPRSGAHGFEVFHSSAKGSADLAYEIHAGLQKVSPFDDRGIKCRGFYVLRKTRIPAVLIESGFLTNPQEGAMIANSSYRQKLAHCIATAIIASH